MLGWRIGFPNLTSFFLSSAVGLYDDTSTFGNFYLRFKCWDMLAVSKNLDFRVLAALVVEFLFVVLQFEPCMSGN